MAIRIQSADQIAAQHGIKVLTYARAGMGKTLMCATAPQPVLISAESGALSIRRQNIERVYGVNMQGITYDIPTIEVKTIQDLIDVEVWCRTSAEARQFWTVCIDSVTEIAEVVLSNAKRQVKDPRQAYGELLEKMVTTVKAFRDLSGKHVYVSAKEERNKDEATGMMLYGPSMPGAKLGPALPYLFDEVFNLSVHKDPATKQEYRYLRTQPDFSYDAKDRSGALAAIEAPHLGYIFNKIMTGS